MSDKPGRLMIDLADIIYLVVCKDGSMGTYDGLDYEKFLAGPAFPKVVFMQRIPDHRSKEYRNDDLAH
jgi:hypothetical protein